MSNQSQVLTILRSGTVVDRSVLVGLSTEEIQTMLDALRNISRRFVVDSANKFFTSANMLALIKADDPRYLLIAEKYGFTLDGQAVAALQNAVRLEAEITAKATPPVPPYAFAEHPKGYCVTTALNIGKSRILRAQPTIEGHGMSYSIGIGTAKTLWMRAGRRWSGDKSSQEYFSLSVGGTYRECQIGADAIVVGCQTIMRYELEQLALHLGWPFPEPKAGD